MNKVLRDNIDSPTMRGRLAIFAYDKNTGEMVYSNDDNNVLVLDSKEALINAVRTPSANYRINRIVTGNDIRDSSGAAYQDVDFGGTVTGAGATGLANDATTYTVDVSINNIPNTVNVTGSAAQTFTTLITEINADLTGATASIVSGNIRITSDSTDPEELIEIDEGSDTLFAACTGFVEFDAAINENNPAPAQDTYTLTTMQNNSTVYYDPLDHGREEGITMGTNSATEIIVNRSLDGEIILSDLGENPAASVKFTSAALITGNGKVFAYKRFPRLSVSSTINVNMVWYVEYL